MCDERGTMVGEDGGGDGEVSEGGQACACVAVGEGGERGRVCGGGGDGEVGEGGRARWWVVVV